MKKLIGVVFLSALIFPLSSSAQWFLDTPTPAEIQARDQPYIILQNEIESKLCDENWAIDKGNCFSFFKDHPDAKEVVRGNGIHYFDLSRWEDQCGIKIKENSPLYQAIMDSIKKVNARMNANNNTGLSLQKAMSDAMKNGGKMPSKDQAILDKKGAINKQCMKDMARLSNAQEFGNIVLQINEVWSDDEKTGAGGFGADVIKPVSIPGVQHAVITIEYPDEDEPDTSYRATLYIGNWHTPDLHKMLEFPFKYNTKYEWTDKAHSGPPVIENFKIFVQTRYYNNLLKIIHNIDWKKLDPLILSFSPQGRR